MKKSETLFNLPSMKIDNTRLNDFLHTIFPDHRIDWHTFDSGAIMIDVHRLADIIVIQYGLTYLGVSVILANDVAEGFMLADEVFYTQELCEAYILARFGTR